ncbi:MAG: GtrA family protein [Lachnospiraceae bacterium]|nr:GtrA family protein [Lachnospiraceae bacterium]
MKNSALFRFYDKHKELILQFLKFGIIGFMNTIISYLINNGLYLLFVNTQMIGPSETLMRQTSNLVAFLVTVPIGYALNSKYTFTKKEDVAWWKPLIKVYASYSITGLFMNAILNYIFELMGIPNYIATFLQLFFTVPTNFLLNKFWAYK